MIKNVFDRTVTDELIARIQQLRPDTRPQWGRMTAGQMLAHCSVPFAYVYEPEKYTKPGPFKRMLFKLFVKKFVVTEEPFKKNSKTGPDLLMKTEKDIEQERERIIDFLNRTQELGENYFDGKASIYFGKLTKHEWNIMFYKHLDYHLGQFGV